MAEIKKCPFRKYHSLQDHISYGRFGKAYEEIPIFGQCIEKECGVWNENGTCCSIVFLGNLQDIFAEIQIIRTGHLCR